jgi:putative transposase
LKQGDEGVSVSKICRKAGIGQATYFDWKKKYAGMLPPEMKRLKQLEDENSRLKKIVADLTLAREMLQEALVRGYEIERISAFDVVGYACLT